MSRVQYDGKRLIPAPLVSLRKSYQTTPDGEKIGSVFNISVIGTLVAFKGSPTSSGTFWTSSGYPPDENIDNNARLGSLIRKQEALRELFSTDGLSMEWQSADGSQPMKCNPRVLDIELQQGNWYNRIDYTITLEADVVYVNGAALGEDEYDEYISAADETWTFETTEVPEGENMPLTYRLTHTVNATGKRFFDDAGDLVRPAWQNARNWVLPKLGFDSTIALSSGVNNLPTYYQGFNHSRSENIGEGNGNYGVTETWILSSGNALEDFTVTVREGLDGLTQVGVDGRITGLDVRDSNFNITSNRYDNANTKFTAVSGVLFTRAQSYSGKSLNINPISTTVGKNPTAGNISYSYEYDTRPSNLVTATKSESITMSDSFDIDEFAAIGVLGRTVGPVLQTVGSHRPTTRGLNIELVFGADFVGGGSATSRLITNHPRQQSPQATELQSIINAANPVLAGALNNIGVPASTAFVSNQSESWDIITGRYSYSIEWTYE